ncbi:unnamed protein product [Ilex paraguariensis]|uniref:Uncharacterized protein n=1 Tax=Ilex paraguariensis TaxID=185542 RepID=A0ABC8UZT2_9AQUA
MWGKIMAGHFPPESLNMPIAGKTQFRSSNGKKPFSLKRVNPVGDYWLTTNSCKIETHSFHLTAKQLDHLLSEICGHDPAKVKSPIFEVLSAILWRSLARIRGESEPRVVTICRNDSGNRENELPNNNEQVISVVETDFTVAKADILELVDLFAEKMLHERCLIEELIESDKAESDFIVYGANLTFVNLEEAEIYGLELNGQKPVYANYSIAGVGDEGVVLVLPGPENGKEGSGRTVTVTLPEYKLVELKNELKTEWGIF